MGDRTVWDDLTPAERDARDARLAAAPRMSEAELAEFRARVRAWDRQNPDIVAQMTRDQLGY